MSQEDRSKALIEAGLVLSSELSLDAVLQRIVEVAAAISGARYGALGVVDHAGVIREFITTGVTPGQRAAIGHIPVGKGLLGLLIREQRPIRIPEIGEDPRSVGFPPNHPPMKSFMGAPVTARGKVFGNIYLTEKVAATEFSEEDEQALIVLAAQAGVAIENARLYAEARRRERWLDGVREVGALIMSGAEATEALELIARRAMELVGADLATVAIPSSDTGELTIAAAAGAHASDILGTTFPRDDSLSGDAVAAGRAILVDDASAAHAPHQPIVGVGDVGPTMLVSLAGGLGTLTVGNRHGGRAFDNDEVQLIQTFATQAVVAIEYERAQRQAQRLLVMEDRERIGKELHDGVIQALFAVGMGLQGAAAMSTDAETARRLDDAVTEIDGAIRDLRNYIFGLRPGILADRQLDQALRQLAKEFEEKTEVVTVVDVDADVAAALASRAADVIQMARESLSNVGRHAHASTCRVSLRRKAGSAILEIDDDGGGFDQSESRAGGQGLANLRTRAEALGGGVDVASSAVDGTTIRIELPF